MNFRSILKPNISSDLISHKDSIFLIGSCFTQNIGLFFQKSYFQTLINPAGTLFHPISILNYLNLCLKEYQFTEEDLIYNQNQFYSWYHSDLQKDTDIELLKIMNENLKIHSEILVKSNFLFITFGTSYAYKYLKTNKIVSNCHKVNSQEFEKIFIEAEEIIPKFDLFLKTLKQINPDIKIILTISPVKHLRDGIIENSFSKANLHVCVKKIVEKHDFVTYFPAYELVIDDLRDYRFFEKDLAHANDFAIEYIIEFFKETYFDANTKSLVKKAESLQLALNHKMKYNNLIEIEKFKKNALSIIEDLEINGLNLTKERKYFNSI